VETSDLIRLGASLGLAADGPPTAMAAGLGGNELWRLPTPAGDVVLRIFPPDRGTEVAEREETAHRFARRHGVLVPPVLGRTSYDGRSVLALGWLDGEPLAAALWRDGSAAGDLGRRSGSVLAGLHAITDPPPELLGSRSWIAWAGELPTGLAARLRADHTGHRLLHLDFHPENLIITADGTLGVLDWANVHVGPPAADLARTLSIMELVRDAHPDIDDRARAAVDGFVDGFLAGYAEAGGDPVVPAPVRAWAYAVQVRDLAGSWVPEWYFQRLRQRCLELAALDQ
jgi:aminoglycoside phosphotransferase (APT) family kinase protein